MNVSIIDYGCGNIVSLKNALEFLGATVQIVRNGKWMKTPERIILPGVGAFGFGMANLSKNGLLDSLNELVLHKKIPILGICLGAQLMLSQSEESPGKDGINWIRGTVKKIQSMDNEYRVPHVGWNCANVIHENPYLPIGSKEVYYHTHSYFMDLSDDALIIAQCEYSHGFTSVFWNENILGCQFHPEKSQRAGLNFLENFLKA